jgi:hypothetical protein
MRYASILLAILALAVAAACGGAAGPVRVAADSPPEPATEASCPVTVPPQPGFVPPEPYPRAPSVPSYVWYGTGELWTVLAADGGYAPRKSVWWSTRLAGRHREEAPLIDVTWRRLDADEAAVVGGGPGTNAHTDEDGWFMIAGIDPDEPGCWRVTARYRGAVLTYTYLVP